MPASRVKLPTVGSVRLVAGLILYAYAACHFISHATGLFLLDAIQAIGHDVLLAPWRTPVGLAILLASFAVHLGLGLWAPYRRRHLRMPALEAWQLGLGLLVPLLLIPHVTDARLGVLLYGLDDSYFRVLYLFWLTEPGTALPRQFALLVVLWIHGSIGIHMWLRFRPWYGRARAGLAAAALLLPLLATRDRQCQLGHGAACGGDAGLCGGTRAAGARHAQCRRRRCAWATQRRAADRLCGAGGRGACVAGVARRA